MAYIVSVFIVLCIGGILFFTNQLSPSKRDRTQFLKELEEYLEAPLVPFPGYENSYSITFTFAHRQFIYEDIMSPGFKDLVNRTLMKGRTNTPFTLDFSEKERHTILRKENEKQKPVAKGKSIRLPKQLGQFSAYSNNPELANKLLKDPAIIRIFSEFKNLNDRGRPVMMMKISNGMVILEFHPAGRCHPKPLSHLASLESLEDHLDKMIQVMKILESLS